MNGHYKKILLTSALILGTQNISSSYAMEQFSEDDEKMLQTLIQKKKLNEKKEEPSLSKTVSNTAKNVSSISYYLEMGSEIGSAILYVLGYENVAEFLEKLSLASKFVGGASKVVYGTTDFVRTKEAKNLLSCGGGLIQIGSSYCQYESHKKNYQLKAKKENIEEKLKENKAKRDNLTKQKDEIKNSLNSKKENNNEDDLEILESRLKEIDQSEKTIKLEYIEIKNERSHCEFQIIGVNCTEEICLNTFEDLQNGGDLYKSLFKNFKNSVKSVGFKLFSQTIKENKDSISKIISEGFGEIKSAILQKTLTNLSIFNLDKNEEIPFNIMND
jgi:hypothetical protein